MSNSGGSELALRSYHQLRYTYVVQFVFIRHIVGKSKYLLIAPMVYGYRRVDYGVSMTIIYAKVQYFEHNQDGNVAVGKYRPVYLRSMI